MKEQNAAQATQELYTVKELCARLRCGKTKAFELVSKRQIASIKIGTKILIPETAIAEFLATVSRPVFNAPNELDTSGHKRSAIEKVARRKVATSKGAA